MPESGRPEQKTKPRRAIAKARRARFGLALTPAEARVFDLTVEGHSYAEIGGTLGLATETVRSHCKNIFKKHGVHGQTELACLYWSTKCEALEEELARCRRMVRARTQEAAGRSPARRRSPPK